jgi:hypothetical protein
MIGKLPCWLVNGSVTRKTLNEAFSGDDVGFDQRVHFLERILDNVDSLLLLQTTMVVKMRLQMNLARANLGTLE